MVVKILKSLAKTTSFYRMCVDSDMKVTWRDKAFSKLGITMESQLLVCYMFSITLKTQNPLERNMLGYIVGL